MSLGFLRLFLLAWPGWGETPGADHRIEPKLLWFQVRALRCFRLAIIGSFCATAGAQTFSIDWYKLAGGGGTSTGGNFSVSGTIGQPDACPTLTGGNYSLTGGFWSITAVLQTADAPNLLITHAGKNVVVSWPDTGSFFLQQNTGLDPGGWTNIAYAVALADGTNSVTFTPATGEIFFRLKQ